MKTTLRIILLLVVLLGFQMLNAQKVSSLTYYKIGSEIKFSELDYSKLTFEKRINIEKKEDIYSVILPFTVTTAPVLGELFWLTLYVPTGSKFASWGIYNAENKFICKSFNSFTIKEELYIIQSQLHLSEPIKKGTYTLKLDFTEKPTTNDVQVSVGYSSQEKYDKVIEMFNERKD